MEKNENNLKDKIAVKVESVSKTFRIPHEKQTSIKGAAVSLLNKRAKGYETFHALSDVSFEVKKGEFFGIIGRNGSGKSTLLKILASIYTPDKGKGGVKINGKLSPFLELGVGFNYELTGRENVFLGGTMLGLTRKQISERFDKIVSFAELEEFIDMKMKNYSSGMQVRLAFALAINVEADILLMDEVLAVGDTNFQNKCLAEFNKYREQGKTVILVTHDIGTVQRYCDRVMLLRSGNIQLIGTAEEVTREYIKQNIHDEEEKIKDKQDQLDESVVNYKSNQAQIKKVEFFDRNNNKKNVFKTGDELLVRIYFDILDKKIKNINFGMTIVSQENIPIIGVSTVIDKIKTDKYLELGYFEIQYNNILLRSNTYHINSAIFGDNHNKVYDYETKIASFKVVSSDQNDGIFALQYDWK